MPTRQFVFVLVIAAMIAAGVGLVVGSRTASDGIGPSANRVAGQVAPAPQEESLGGPATQAVTASKSQSGTRAGAAASADGKRIDAAKADTKAGSAGATSASKPLGPKGDSKPEGAAKSSSAAAATPSSPDSAMPFDVALPLPIPTLPDKISSSSESEFVFVSRSALLKGKVAANEAAAIATLRSVSSSQAQMQSAGVVDTDADGAGEYAYFGELAGTAGCRVPRGEARFQCSPAVLNSTFGKVTPAGDVLRNGYFFRMYLPGPTANRKIAGIPEASGGGASTTGATPDHDNCEIYYSVYAWPAEPGVSGNRAFFLNQEGDMLVFANANGTYAGESHIPAFDAALSAPRSGDMAAPYVTGAKSNDGQPWNLYQGPEPRMQAFVELGPATKADAEKGNAPDDEKLVVPRSAIRRAQMAESESVAIASLRVIGLAQETARAMHAIDTDNDGNGEYGFFGELAGTSPCRAAAGGKRALMKPPMLSSAMGRVSNAGNLVKDGYVYRMYLPGATANGKVAGLSEAPGGGCVTSGPRPNADNSEAYWCAYAWPLEAGVSGQRAFFADAEGVLMLLENADGFYSGEEKAPTFDAVLDASQPGNMKVSPAIGTKSVDGRAWMPM